MLGGSGNIVPGVSMIPEKYFNNFSYHSQPTMKNTLQIAYIPNLLYKTYCPLLEIKCTL